MRDWLGTREVALRLKVSEASVRRWSDAGLLPVERVGRRGERRFQEGDILRFLEQGLQGEEAGRDLAKPTGVTLGGNAMALGSHIATLYDSDAARFRLTIPFLSAGLRQGQACLLVAAGKVLEGYLAEVGAQDGVDLDAAISSGIFATASELGNSADGASARWQELAWAAAGRGSGVLRVVGEMTWALGQLSPSSELLHFEDALNSMTKRHPAVVVCQYDAREFDGKTLLGAIKTHPDIFEMNLGSLIG